MKLFQISDLHLDNDFSISQYDNMLTEMVSIIKRESKDTGPICIVCCGDITNKGNKDFFHSKAIEVFDYLKHKFHTLPVEFIFVPGNHDLCDGNFIMFQNFIAQYTLNIDFSQQDVVLYETEQIGFLLINTSFHKQFQFGNVNLNQIKEQLNQTQKPIIVVMHHTLMSRYDDDRSGISNAYSFLDLIQNNNVIAIVHGHTHGYSNILVGQQCRVIGVGSLFSYFKNCNNQFNVIDIGLNQINQVINYRYHSDLGHFRNEILYKNQQYNNFKSTLASKIYIQIREAVKYFGGISNLNLRIESDFNSFQRDMNCFFKHDIETAKLWLKETVPSTLYYNHGSYMIDKDIKGIDYIIDELKRNSTSNRAIIPLIRLADVLEHKFNYLPGLNSIQFGFLNDEKTELICSVYLRSLEVNHFLRINLSEIYLLISRLHDEIRSIKSITINMYAFKAQYKEKFSCFRRALIDTSSPGEIANIIYSKNLVRLIELLEDKFQMQETVINTEGLCSLYDIMYKSEIYSKNCTEKLKTIIDTMMELDSEYKKNSDYSTISPLEMDITQKQQDFLITLRNESHAEG